MSSSSVVPPAVGEGAGDASVPAPQPPSLSEVTRLLSIGAHVGREFADRVIEVLLNNRQRFAAPAYGYDAATVLGHALAARHRRKAKTALLAAAVGQWLLIGVLVGPLGSTAFWVTAVIGLWGIWVTLLIEKIVTRQIITVHLRPPRQPSPPYGFDGQAPLGHEDRTELYDEIRQEQDASAGIVYYSGYVPFVGAGDQLRSWSFAVLLERAKEGRLSALRPPAHPSSAMPAEGSPAASGTTPRTEPPSAHNGHAEPTPFTAEELTAYVQEKLTTHLLTEVREAGQRLDGLKVTRRLYAQAVGPVRPDPAARAAARDSATGGEPSDDYNAAREFVAVTVGSWSQELVLTVFLNVDLKGRVLYTQLHAYQLMPIKAAYHRIDRLPDGVDAKVLSTLAGEALADILTFPLTLLSRLKRRQGSRGASSAASLHEQGEWYTDWGALTSIRELGSSPVFHHYFQQMDSAKYFKVIERRTLEVILDFLDQHHVDTTEYRARQAEVLNVGILQTGSGTIVNRGATAVGSRAAASAR